MKQFAKFVILLVSLLLVMRVAEAEIIYVENDPAMAYFFFPFCRVPGYGGGCEQCVDSYVLSEDQKKCIPAPAVTGGR